MNNLFEPGSCWQTPKWLTQKLSRRQILKSAAGAAAIASASRLVMAKGVNDDFQNALNSKEWQTLDAVLNHLLPSSASGPGAKEIQATFYLYQLVHQQPTVQDEIDFIFKGVNWLNGYSDNQLSKQFIELTQAEKQQVLTGISRSQAGRNWLNMLILNIYEAMLSPPAYGGNPDGIGWRWLEHQAGFPLPQAGQRYYELPLRSRPPANTATTTANNAQNTYKVALSANYPVTKKGTRKA